MPKDRPTLKSGRFYEVTRDRLFGPKDVMPEQINVVSLAAGSLVQCDKVLVLNDGHSGRGSYVAFSIDGADEMSITARVGIDRKVPAWLKEAHPLKVLALAAG